MKVWNKKIVHVEWISTGTQLDVFLVFLDKYGHSLKSVASIFSIPILYFPCCLWTKSDWHMFLTVLFPLGLTPKVKFLNIHIDLS